MWFWNSSESSSWEAKACEIQNHQEEANKNDNFLYVCILKKKISATSQTAKAQRRHQHPAWRRKVAATNNTRRMWSTCRCRAQKLLCTSQVLLTLPVGTPGNSMYIACSNCARVERAAASVRGNVSGGKVRIQSGIAGRNAMRKTDAGMAAC